jgi:hypothetical protein
MPMVAQDWNGWNGVTSQARVKLQAPVRAEPHPTCRSPALRVCAAFLAEADLSAAVRLRAAVRACRDNASGEAAAPLSRWSAFKVACDRLAEGFFPESAFSRSRCAWCRVASDVLPGFGGANFTPARRALESPMAMACFVERAPCLPARISSISSRTNSPAWVEADFPSRSSERARSMVCFFGIIDAEYSLLRSQPGVFGRRIVPLCFFSPSAEDEDDDADGGRRNRGRTRRRARLRESKSSRFTRRHRPYSRSEAVGRLWGRGRWWGLCNHPWFAGFNEARRLMICQKSHAVFESALVRGGKPPGSLFYCCFEERRRQSIHPAPKSAANRH